MITFEVIIVLDNRLTKGAELVMGMPVPGVSIPFGRLSFLQEPEIHFSGNGAGMEGPKNFMGATMSWNMI